MLAEEFDADKPRTLPSELAVVYPWAKMDMPVIEHCLRVALRRDSWKDHVKDVNDVQHVAERISVEKLGKKSNGKVEPIEQGLVDQLSSLTIQSEEDAVIERLREMNL